MARVYYAHCTAIYNTPQEARDISTLQMLGFAIDNPNCSECAEGYANISMEFFRSIVANADALAFRALPDGSIPAGVATEIQMAIDLGKPVFELPSCVLRRSLSVDVTRQYLKEVGSR